jgi:hypothetical protein
MARFGRAGAANPPVTLPDSVPGQGDRGIDWNVTPGGGRLGELLVESRLVDRADVLAALQQKRAGARQRLGRLLIDRGAVSERDLTTVLARQHSLDVIDLHDVTPEPV